MEDKIIYSSLPTTFRPFQFKDVYGQDVVVETLKSIAKSQGVKVRSIFLYGSYGSGKTTTARLFGKAVNCETFKKTGEVCEVGKECNACKEAIRKNSQTYIEFDSTRVGSVEAIRGMEDLFSSSAPYGYRRVLVFDEIATASKASQNALLKVVEEGVKDTFFVFCSTDKIIDTLVSRSITLEVGTIPFHLIKQRVKEVAEQCEIEISESELDALSVKSRGHMRNALSILEHYQLAGNVALKTSLRLLKKFVHAVITKKDVNPIIEEILLFPITDIRSSVSIMCKDFFVSEEKFDSAVRKSGMHHKIFNFFYNPTSQEALKDEYGVEILLRAFNERI